MHSLSVSSASILDRRTLGDWLSSLNFKQRYNDILDQRTEGTGQWFLELDVFRSWTLSAGPEILWCKGMRKLLYLFDYVQFLSPFTAGSGKTVLS
jgi:hypothetical protein